MLGFFCGLISDTNPTNYGPSLINGDNNLALSDCIAFKCPRMVPELSPS